MASSLFTDDLTCSICLNIFSDPVTLHCGHSFCRECVGGFLAVSNRCPQCSLGVVEMKAHDLPTSFILNSLAEKARGVQSPEPDKVQASDLCPEHEEKLKLLCFTDHQLACIICRDSERHEGHKFKPVKEAEAVLRTELENLVRHLSSDIEAVESVAHEQQEEITRNKEKSDQLMTEISKQFNEMHEFLTRREKEIKNELKQKQEEDLMRLLKNVSFMETALSESRELQDKANSTLSITDTEKFLKTWSEEKKKESGDLFSPRVKEIRVENSSFSLGPYESHLKFFVWKEMLTVIQPQAKRLTLTRNSQNILITNSGRSLIWNNNFVSLNPRCEKPSRVRELLSLNNTGAAESSTKFTSGQHYWEVDVGSQKQWRLGTVNSYLYCDGQQYTVYHSRIKNVVTLVNTPQKFGCYLNLSSQQLSFYDADNMTHIDTVDLCLGSNPEPVSAYFNISGVNAYSDPLTVCWY